MKKLCLPLLAASLTAAVSCGKVAPDPGRAGLISVRASEMRTKGDVSAMKKEGNSIDLTGAVCTGDVFVPASASSIGHGYLRYRGLDDSWYYYSDPKFWTNASTYRFRAVSPAECYDSYEDDLSGSMCINGFTVAAQQARQADLLVCAIASRTTEDVLADMDTTPVPLEFEHVLSCINVKVRQSGAGEDAFVLTGVQLSGMYARGDYDSVFDGAAWNGSWSRSGSETITCSQNAFANPTLPVDGSAVSAWDTGLYLIPQDPSSVRLAVAYRVTHDGKTSAKTVSAYLDGGDWEIGRRYTYTVTLTEDYELRFDEPQVETWGSEQAGGTIIIR